MVWVCGVEKRPGAEFGEPVGWASENVGHFRVFGEESVGVKYLGAVVAALVLMGSSGCSRQEAGFAESKSPSGASGVSSPLASASSPARPVSLSINPCGLVSEEDLAEVGKFEKKYQEAASARTCYWQHTFENGGDGFGFAVGVRDSQSIEAVNDNGSGVHSDEVNQRPSVWTVDPKFDDCVFSMKVDEGARVDITVAGDSESNDSCEVAKVIAGMVEPRLPELP